MDERDIREEIAQVRAGALSRLQFTRTMLGLGFTGPMVAQLLALAGVARAQPKPAFTWEFAADPASAATTAGQYRPVTRVENLDSHTVKVVFANPEPFWPIVFCGSPGAIIPKHVFEPFKGAKSREAPANLKPVGTGPYRIVDFKPGDTIRAELNPSYHRPNWPFFDRLQM